MGRTDVAHTSYHVSFELIGTVVCTIAFDFETEKRRASPKVARVLRNYVRTIVAYVDIDCGGACVGAFVFALAVSFGLTRPLATE